MKSVKQLRRSALSSSLAEKAETIVYDKILVLLLQSELHSMFVLMYECPFVVSLLTFRLNLGVSFLHCCTQD